MSGRIIVTLTSYKKRLEGLPTILNSIFEQTVTPDFIVLNLAHGETLSHRVQSYLDEKQVIIQYIEDTKIYKKVIPTLKRFPDDIIICIDDDIIYPPEMIEEFLAIHKEHPNFPISGNKVIFHGIICHCGCASLIKASFFGDYLEKVDAKELLNNCPCDDVAYTYFCTKNNHPYIQTKNTYFLNLPQLYPNSGYSLSLPSNSISDSYEWLCKEYGKQSPVPEVYAADETLSQVLKAIFTQLGNEIKASNQEIERLKSTKAFRIGKKILAPFYHLKSLFIK